MPKIREYGPPNLEFQGVNPDSSAELQYSGATGRSLQKLGEQVETVGEAMHRRQEMEETSDLNADFAELSAEVTYEIDESVRDGSIDTQEYSVKLQDKINQLGDGIGTSQGRRIFERNAARLQAQAFKRASRGQAAVAGAKASANLQTELSSYSAGLFSDPSEFSSNHSSMLESIDDQVSLGTIKSADAEKLKLVASKDLAKSAMRGWAQLSPDIAEKKLNSGEFDGYLDGDAKSQMQGYINQQRTAKLTEVRRAEAEEKRAEKLRGDAWMEKNLKSIIDGTTSTETIMKAPLKPKEKMSLINAVAKNAEDGGGRTNPRVKNEITRRILLPAGDPDKIVDIQQFVDQVGQGISMKDVGELNSFLQKTPEGEAMADGEKRLFDMAKKTLGQKDLRTGFFDTDQDAEYNISRYMAEYQRQKARLISEKKDPSLLVNPDSKEYFGFRLNEYKLTPQQIIQKKAEIMRKEVDTLGKKRVEVLDPDGKLFTLPEENLSKLPKGWKRK